MVRAPFAAMITTSQLGSGRAVRKLSRAIRLKRLRSTDRGMVLRETVIPNFAPPPRPACSNAVKLLLRRLRPSEMTRLNSAGRSRRTERGNPVNRSAACADRLRNQAGAALGTTTSEDLAAAHGCHAGAEAVGARATERVWLVGAFHRRKLGAEKRARSVAAESQRIQAGGSYRSCG